MRVGIITMHRIPNYGSFMQALSLKKMIESLGHEVIFIDYNVDPDIEHRDDFRSLVICKKKWLTKQIKGTWLGNKLYYSIKGRSKNRTIVEKQRIFSSCDYMLGVTRKYHYRVKVDVLVIGSDEVFNCTQLGYNVGYSLELFGKNCRANRVITYAASFGNTTYSKLLDYNVTSELRELLNKMDDISVRDMNSQIIIKKLCNINAKRHLDPVLVGNITTLLEKYEQKIPYDKYIVLYGYTYRFTEAECTKIMKFAHQSNRTVLVIGEPQYKCDHYICCRPNEVLNFFKKADFIITDTFHGTIFSVITHKKFLTVIRFFTQNGNEEKLRCLLQDLDLSQRELQDFNNLSKIQESIDYDKVDVILKNARKEAMNYLMENIKL